MKSRQPFIRTAIVLGLLGASPALHAASSGNGSVGLQLGLTFPSIGGTTISYGLQLAYKLLTIAKTQAYAQRFSSSVESTEGANAITASSSTTVIGATAAFPLFSGALDVGPTAGLVTFSSEGSATDGTTVITTKQSASGMFIGPSISKTFSLSGSFAVAADAQYLYSLSSSTPKIFQLLATIKYQF